MGVWASVVSVAVGSDDPSCGLHRSWVPLAELQAYMAGWRIGILALIIGVKRSGRHRLEVFGGEGVIYFIAHCGGTG